MTPTPNTTAGRGHQALQRGVLLAASLALLGGPEAHALPGSGDLGPYDLQRLAPAQQRDYFLGLRRLEDQRHERALDLQARSEWCYRNAGVSLSAIRSCWAAAEEAGANLEASLLEERRRLDRRFGLLARGPASMGAWPVATADPYGSWPSWPRRDWR